MIDRKMRFGFGAGVASLFVEGLGGIVLVHLVFENLSPKEAGYWTIVATIGALFLILPSSLSLAISRTIAQSKIFKENASQSTAIKEVHLVVRFQQGAVVVLSVLIFAFYIYPILKHQQFII